MLVVLSQAYGTVCAIIEGNGILQILAVRVSLGQASNCDLGVVVTPPTWCGGCTEVVQSAADDAAKASYRIASLQLVYGAVCLHRRNCRKPVRDE